MSSAKDVNNLLSWGENWLFHYSGVKNTNRVEARVLKPISTSKLLSPTPAEIAGGRRHQHMTAISPQSSIFTSPYLLSSFVNCYWATWRCLHHHRRAVVGFFLLCGFVLLFRFPPRLINAPLPSQIRWCCRDLQRTRAARTHTHTYTHTYTHILGDSVKKPGRFSTSSSTGSQTGRGGERRRNHCRLNAPEWFMAQRGQKGTQRRGNASLWHSFKRQPRL